jgi:uncharacterized protein (TIRG00374 family)
MRQGWHWLLVLLGLTLAWHALRGAAWTEVWRLLAGLGPLAILVLVTFNLLMLPIMSARWWLLLRALGVPVGLLAVCGYRCAANTVSYLTPGPHFGGEPLAVYLLHSREGISLPPATASVAVDRLLELAATLVVVAIGFQGLALSGIGSLTGNRRLLVAIAVLVGLVAFLSALFTGGRPLSRFLVRCRWLGKIGSLTETVGQGETMVEVLFRQHRRPLLLANAMSLCHWLAVFSEFWLMAFLLGFPLSFGHLTAVVLVARLAFLTPLPAGIGVLETALPWLTASLGLGSTLGLSLCLLIRFRDLLFCLGGLALTMNYLTCREKAGIINNISE